MMFRFGITTRPLGVEEGVQGNTEGFLLPEPQHSLLDRLKLQRQKNAQMDALATTLVDNLSEPMLRELRDLFPMCGLIANCSVGYNHIDIAAARRYGFKVTNTPFVLTDATADLTIGLIFMITRRMWEGAKVIETEGRYVGWRPDYMLGRSIQNKVLGIVGMGDIGKATAKRAAVFGMKVIALKSSWSAQNNAVDGIERFEEDEFLSRCDVLSFHCKLTKESTSWFNTDRLKKLKPGCYVINTARGEIIDEAALRQALDSGHLAGAALDVFCNEPVLSAHLRGAPNLVVLPHLGSSTVETRTAMGDCVMQNIRAFAANQPLLTPIF